jgi:hypothetical protein
MSANTAGMLEFVSIVTVHGTAEIRLLVSTSTIVRVSGFRTISWRQTGFIASSFGTMLVTRVSKRMKTSF